MNKLNYFAFLFVLALEITLGQTNEFECPIEDVVNGCDFPKSCLYPNPKSCEGYIQCDDGGRVFHRKCPSKLHWNNEDKRCDWPDKVKCEHHKLEATATTQRPVTPIPGYKCPAQDVAGGCRGPTDCLYPNPANCSSFIQCTAAGLAYVMPCPAGLQWNDNLKVCDWPPQSTCGKTPSPPSTTTSTTTVSSTTTSSTTRPQSSTATQTSTASPTTEAQPSTTTQSPTTLPTTEAQPLTTTQSPTTLPTNGPQSSTTTQSPTSLPTNGPQSSTTTQTSTTPVCGNDDDQDPEDADLDLGRICSGCSQTYLVENPNSQERYIECNGGPDNNKNSIKKCSPGLLFDSDKLTCDYSGLVNSIRY